MPATSKRAGGAASQAGAAGPDPAAGVLTAAEAAQFLRVSEAALLQEAEAGRVPGRKIGGEWRFLKLGLAEWLATPEPPAAAKPLSSKERMLSLAGSWKDDPTSLEMVEEIYRERKRNLVGGP